jgi:hypothetical protein
MKLYLASYLEPEKYGPGKKYAIASSKPNNLTVDGGYVYFIPKTEIMNKYHDLQLENQVEAAEYFNKAFKEQLDNFLNELQIVAKEENKLLSDLLPFNEGDTLLSWEREGNTSYRYLVAEYLNKIGYETVLR